MPSTTPYRNRLVYTERGTEAETLFGRELISNFGKPLDTQDFGAWVNRYASSKTEYHVGEQPDLSVYRYEVKTESGLPAYQGSHNMGSNLIQYSLDGIRYSKQGDSRSVYEATAATLGHETLHRFEDDKFARTVTTPEQLGAYSFHSTNGTGAHFLRDEPSQQLEEEEKAAVELMIWRFGQVNK